MPRRPSEYYLGAKERLDTIYLPRYENGEYLAQPKMDGMWIELECYEDSGITLTTRWNEWIKKGCSNDNGLSDIVVGVNCTLVGELEAASQHSKKVVNERGYRKIHLFDIIRHDDCLCQYIPLESRLKILDKVYERFSDEAKKRIEIVPTYYENFEELYAKSHEGIMVKRRLSKYTSRRVDKKTDDWIKFKKKVSQSMVICGFTYTKINQSLRARVGLFDGKKIVACLTASVPGLREHNKTQYLNKIADFVGFEITDKGSLRSGGFDQWRPDLTIDDCVFGQEVSRY